MSAQAHSAKQARKAAERLAERLLAAYRYDSSIIGRKVYLAAEAFKAYLAREAEEEA